MATKHINDAMVVEAALVSSFRGSGTSAIEYLEYVTEESHKVCLRAVERACSRGLIDYGVSLRRPWPTPEGLSLLIRSARSGYQLVRGVYDAGNKPLDPRK